ncbi:MAG: helix-turn-helix domain-containing protein [Flavobacteriales bacterium]
METNFTGTRIAAARKAKNMSQAQLAQRLFISPQAVGKWERGESVPDIITVGKLAHVLGVDLNYFSERIPVNAAPDQVEVPVERIVAATPVRERPKPTRDMSRFKWADADFSGLKDLHEKFSGALLKNCKFIDSDLAGVLLENNHMEGCDFRGANQNGSRFRSSHVAKTRFNDSRLMAAEFTESVLNGCDLSGAVLTDVVVRSSSFQKNTLSNAVLVRTTFRDTDLTDVLIEGPLEDCTFENCGFSRVTFQNATLHNTFFKSQRLKRIRFMDCSADRLTYEFLKNGRADVSGIAVIDQV